MIRSAETDVVEIVVVETEVVAGLVEHGDPNLLDHLFLGLADALDVALIELNAVELAAAREGALLRVRDAGDDPEASWIDAVFHEILGGIVGRHDREILEMLARLFGDLGER